MICIRLREWIKKTQPITVDLLWLTAREENVDHVKQGPGWSMMI